MTRVNFPRSVQVAIIKRASSPNGTVCCEKCGVQVKAGGFDIDHRVPDAMFTSEADKRANATVEGGQLLCSGPTPDYCHRSKTSQDVADIAKAKSREARHLGVKQKSRFQTSRDGAWKQKIGGQIVPR